MGKQACLAGTFEAVFVEIFFAQAGLKFIICPGQQGAFPGLVVFHVHRSGVPVFAEVLFKIGLRQSF